MKRLSLIFILYHLSFLLSHFSLSTVSAQNPSWSKKAAQAVFTLKTFGADGSLLGSSNGFFVGENGEALSSFTPFKGASRAVVIDAQGKEWPVECLMGANDMYDVAKFLVTVKKPTALPLAASASDGATAWVLPYAVKKAPACVKGTVSSSEKFQGDYAYYTLAMQVSEQHAGSPVLNDNGEVLGLLQPSASAASASCYAVSASFANDLRIGGLSQNDPALRSTSITKALPDQLEEAMLAVYMAATAMDAAQYEDLVNRFIQKFPNAAEGYIYRARHAAAKGDFAAAHADMQQALKADGKKDDTHYQFAQLIYQKEVYQHDQPFSDWSLDLALEQSRKANSLNPQPVYLQQQAQILYAQQKYDEAFALYEQLTQTPLRDAALFYAAAQCKLQQGDKKVALAMLDSAVSTFTKPYIKTAAPYLRAHAQLCMDCRRYQLAINDMEAVVALEPNNAELWAEKGSYELRVNLLDQAMTSARECLRLAPENSDGYLILGVAQCLKGQKQEGLEHLNKAKELGNSQAQTLIEKYGDKRER